MGIERELAGMLATQPEIKLGILFGSLARGQARPESDLDLAVAAARPLDSEAKTALITTLAQVAGRAVDLIDLQAVSGPMLLQALTSGRVIHCTDRRLYAELIKKMLFYQADMRPYYRRMLTERRQRWLAR
jgi:predicted nucleotidyltransferase